MTNKASLSNIVSWFKNLPRKLGLVSFALLIVTALLVTSQIERFITHGTLLGYSVRHVQPSIEAPSKTSPFSGLPANQKSLACDKASQGEVSKIMGNDVTRMASFLPDRSAPNVISTCLYRTKPDAKTPAQTISLLYRELASANDAQLNISNLEKQSQGADIAGVGDKAYFIGTTNQLTAQQGKKVVTVTISRVSQAAADQKDQAIQLAKLLLK